MSRSRLLKLLAAAVTVDSLPELQTNPAFIDIAHHIGLKLGLDYDFDEIITIIEKTPKKFNKLQLYAKLAKFFSTFEEDKLSMIVSRASIRPLCIPKDTVCNSDEKRLIDTVESIWERKDSYNSRYLYGIVTGRGCYPKLDLDGSSTFVLDAYPDHPSCLCGGILECSWIPGPYIDSYDRACTRSYDPLLGLYDTARSSGGLLQVCFQHGALRHILTRPIFWKGYYYISHLTALALSKLGETSTSRIVRNVIMAGIRHRSATDSARIFAMPQFLCMIKICNVSGYVVNRY